MDKKCSKCGETKPIDEFSHDKSRKDGRSVWCKDCSKIHHQNNREKDLIQMRRWHHAHREDVLKKEREYYQAHRQEHTEYNREYRQTPAGIAARKKENDNYREKHGKEISARTKHYRNLFPEKYKAHEALTYAVKTGKLPAVQSQKCSVCKNKQAQEYHHHRGYDKEHWLDVIPVCSKCHKILDKHQSHTDTN